MHLRRLVPPLGLALSTLLALTGRTWAVEAVVTDSAGQTLTLGNVGVLENQRRLDMFGLSLPSGGGESEPVNLSLAVSSIKEIVPDPAAGERGYRTRLVVTLHDGTQFRGEASGQLQGDNELGGASIELGKLNKAVFTRGSGDSDYTVKTGAVQAQLTDRQGRSFDLASLATASGNDQKDVIECSLGEIKLAVPLQSVSRIENIGEIKREYSTDAKLRLSLTSGKSLEVSVGSGPDLRGEFKHGVLKLPFKALKTAVLQKKN